MLPCAQILVVEGLHPFHDERVRKLMDFHVYLDISDEVKEAWKIHRDMNERGHSEESIRASIAARKPDFDAYIDPQKKHADVIIQASPPGSAAQAGVQHFAHSTAAERLGRCHTCILHAHSIAGNMCACISGIP